MADENPWNVKFMDDCDGGIILAVNYYAINEDFFVKKKNETKREMLERLYETLTLDFGVSPEHLEEVYANC